MKIKMMNKKTKNKKNTWLRVACQLASVAGLFDFDTAENS